MKEYEIIKGKRKLLFSAPHPYPHRRPSLVKKYKGEERYTDDIVKAICKEKGCFGIYILDTVEYDPNYNKIQNPYKNEIEKLIKQNNIETFIDIHGLSDEHMIDIAIYYKTRFINSIKLAKKVAELLDNGDLRGLNIQILRLPEGTQESLTEYVASKLRVPSVQIEIARYIRDDKDLREEVVENLAEIVA